MATQIYERKYVKTFDGLEIEISPLKIKYLKEFMIVFNAMQFSENDEDSISILCECTRIAMKQFLPEISNSIEDIEENFDLPTIYKIIEYSSGVKINAKSDETIKKQAEENGPTWKDLDLAKIESEIFLLGIWKDYNELETSISMPELTAILQAKRESEYEDKKFLAAMQGVDLDKNRVKAEEDPWTKLKNKVFNNGRADDDILTFRGDKAVRAGFGIGMGLDYEDLR